MGVVMDKCYKCKSTEELSIKARNKSGHTRYMCRPCRRTAAQQTPTTPLHYTNSDIKWDAEERENWAQRSKDSLERINRRAK